MSSEPLLLAIRDLRIETSDRHAPMPILRGVSLEVRRGEVLGLIGESGAGKSTAGLAALGIVRPGCRIAGGSILFDGLDLATAPESVRRALRGGRITYVAQSAAASFNPAHRLIDQAIESVVAHSRMTRRDARARAVELYGQLRLPDPESFGERFPHQTSGGQLQRAMLAMAMISKPDLIVFDEPTTALDVTTQIEVVLAIQELIRDSGVAAIYITHDLALVAQVADRIVVLKDGAVVEEAPTRTMLAAPKEDYTKTLWAVRELTKPPAPTTELLMRVDGISASYGRQPVLHDVSFEVKAGHTVAVVGESGSGKSTLARTICGLLPPSTGSVAFGGTMLPPRVSARNQETLRAIQLIHQSPDASLNPRQRVETIVGRPLQLFGGVSRSELDSRIDAMLQMVELGPRYRRRFPGELSGGEKQRVAIARALAADPGLIVCDEITSALDQVVQREILNLLLRLQAETGVTYLFITHDLATVRAIADDIVVMHQGRIVEQGRKDAVLQPPHEPYTERLLTSVPEMDPDWLSRLVASRGAHSPAARSRKRGSGLGFEEQR